MRVSRRKFLRDSGRVAAGIAGAVLIGCGDESEAAVRIRPATVDRFREEWSAPRSSSSPVVPEVGFDPVPFPFPIYTDETSTKVANFWPQTCHGDPAPRADALEEILENSNATNSSDSISPSVREQIEQRTVGISGLLNTRIFRSYGHGFKISDEYVVTAAHVLGGLANHIDDSYFGPAIKMGRKGASRVHLERGNISFIFKPTSYAVIVESGDGIPQYADSVQRSLDADVALLHITSFEKTDPVPMRPLSDVKEGESLYASSGGPRISLDLKKLRDDERSWLRYSGELTGRRTDIHERENEWSAGLQHTHEVVIPGVAGFSGMGIFDSDGNYVGMLNSGARKIGNEVYSTTSITSSEEILPLIRAEQHYLQDC